MEVSLSLMSKAVPKRERIRAKLSLAEEKTRMWFLGLALGSQLFQEYAEPINQRLFYYKVPCSVCGKQVNRAWRRKSTVCLACNRNIRKSKNLLRANKYLDSIGVSGD